MRVNTKYKSRSKLWWTRERIITGLKKFYEDFGFCALSTEQYSQHQQFTGRDAAGRISNRGWHQKYPAAVTIFNYFATMREAWTAAGFDVDRSFEEWTAMEDWFVLESVGVLPRDEVAEILKRSGPAIKRRLYDLGDTRAYNRWGITLTHACTLMGLNDNTVRKYMEYGIIPFFRGNKLFYLNPANLLKVEEFDWTATVDPELERLVRVAVAQRICKMLKFGAAWRDHEVYRFHRTKERFQGRIKNPRQSVFNKDNPAPPNDLDTGDWCRTTGKVRSMQTEVGKRHGVIKRIYYSWQRVSRYDGTTRAAWVAMVEFPKIRTITGEKDRRIRYAIPLDYLERVEPPKPAPRPLSTHPEAIKGRKRIASGEHDRRRKRIRERVSTFAGDLT